MKAAKKHLSDKELIKACREEDPKGLEDLYTTYCKQLFTSAYYILHDYDMANDCLHDAFIKIFHDIHSLKNNQSLLPWMRRVVINTSLVAIKRYRKIEYKDQPIAETALIWPEPMNGELLEKALFSLPDGYRIVFSLIEIEGYKHREVAQMLKISIGTSKSQLFNAKKHLRKILSSEH